MKRIWIDESLAFVDIQSKNGKAPVYVCHNTARNNINIEFLIQTKGSESILSIVTQEKHLRQTLETVKEIKKPAEIERFTGSKLTCVSVRTQDMREKVEAMRTIERFTKPAMILMTPLHLKVFFNGVNPRKLKKLKEALQNAN